MDEKILLTISIEDDEMIIEGGENLRPIDLLDVVYGCSDLIAKNFLRGGSDVKKAEEDIIQAVVAGVAKAIRDAEAKQ